SLAQLKRYPLHIIKIDRSFVCDISPEEGGAIVRTIIKLAHNLGMTVIAEGVETPLQADFLRSHQCDAIQGYFVSKPLSAADFETWMQDFHARKGHDLQREASFGHRQASHCVYTGQLTDRAAGRPPIS